MHKHHHVFHNPTPFAVIADEWMDEFIRSMPMVILVIKAALSCAVLYCAVKLSERWVPSQSRVVLQSTARLC